VKRTHGRRENVEQLDETRSELDEYTLTMAEVAAIIKSEVTTVVAISDSKADDPGHLPNHQKIGPTGRVQRRYRPADVDAWLRRGFK
jgi:hypothetical protein